MILGGGRVGRAASRALSEEGVPNTIVELEAGRVENSYSVLEGTASYAVVEGDAADQRVLRRAGLDQASAVLVTPRDDDLNVYLTLFCRRLRPELQLVSRATYERNVATLYRAGADSVLSYATIGATDLWNHAGLSHRVLIAEGSEMFLAPRPSSLTRRPVGDEQVQRRTGCRIVGLLDDAGILHESIEDAPSGEYQLLLLGDRHAERAFRETYLGRRNPRH